MVSISAVNGIRSSWTIRQESTIKVVQSLGRGSRKAINCPVPIAGYRGLVCEVEHRLPLEAYVFASSVAAEKVSDGFGVYVLGVVQSYSGP
jgi:hypothetical protein